MRGIIVILGFALLMGHAQGVSVMTRKSFQVRRLEPDLRRELKVFKDPSLFMEQLSHFYEEGSWNWKDLLRETPLLTTLSGKVCILQLGRSIAFNQFGIVSKLYAMAEPGLNHSYTRTSRKGSGSSRIIPVQLCNEDAYSETLGFVLEEDLRLAQMELYEEGKMPPSNVGNPIPGWHPNQESRIEDRL